MAYAPPVVVMVHGLSFLHVTSSTPGVRLALRALVPWSVRRAAHVITRPSSRGVRSKRAIASLRTESA
jgi:hypothetical protein